MFRGFSRGCHTQFTRLAEDLGRHRFKNWWKAYLAPAVPNMHDDDLTGPPVTMCTKLKKEKCQTVEGSHDDGM
jgi:hypothetical protein